MSRDLRFRRLRLRNWKNFQGVDVALQNRLFLVGANASGKSNFLDAFRFLRDIALSGSGFREAVLHPRRGGVSGIRCLAARQYPDVEITVHLEEEGGVAWEYEIAFHQDKQRRPRIRTERVSRDGKALVKRPNKQDSADPEQLTQTYLEQVNVNQPFRDLAVFFGSIRYLHLVPQLVREPDRSVGRTNDPTGIRPDVGGNRRVVSGIAGPRTRCSASRQRLPRQQLFPGMAASHGAGSQRVQRSGGSYGMGSSRCGGSASEDGDRVFRDRAFQKGDRFRLLDG